MIKPRPLVATFFAMATIQLAGPTLAHAHSGAQPNRPHRIHHVTRDNLATTTTPVIRTETDAPTVTS